MTGFPILRPPRQSPATAYLQHLQQKRSTGVGVKSGPYSSLSVCADEDASNHSPQSVVMRKSSSSVVLLPPAAVVATPSPPSTSRVKVPKPRTLGSRSRSAQTFATCGTLCSEEDRSSSRSTANNSSTSDRSANSNSSLGDGDHRSGRSNYNFPLSFPDDFVASTGASSTTETTAIVPHRLSSSHHHHHDTSTLASRDPPPPPTSPSSSRSSPSHHHHILSSVVSEDDPTSLLLLEGCSDLYCDNDDDSMIALDRLLSETSKRWSESTQQTHREFCRLSFCPCRKQESIIAQQAAEIAQLREQLVVQQQQQAAAAEEEAFPLEQIEVYHDNEDHCSVTSGLTQHYDTASLATGQHSQQHQQPPPAVLERRPDAASVTGTQSVHLPPTPPTRTISTTPPTTAITASNSNNVTAKTRKTPLLPPSSKDIKTPLRARNRLVSLTAADGTTRQAIYTGDVSTTGQPNGCGVLKFATGDYYMGQLQHGQMHGQGTFVVNRKSPKKQEVLKGHFERNVFTG